MASTSKKHNNFAQGPMGDKSVRDLPGIGKMFGEKLEGEGFDKAYVVLGQFLVLKKDKASFECWLQGLTQCNTNHATQCYQCLADWCAAFL